MDVRSPKARGDKRRNNLRDSNGGRNLYKKSQGKYVEMVWEDRRIMY